MPAQPAQVFWGGGGFRKAQGHYLLMQFFSLGSSIMEISKTDCFDIMTIHDDQISDLQGLPQETKYTHLPQKKFNFCFYKIQPLPRKRNYTHLPQKKFETTKLFFVHELHF